MSRTGTFAAFVGICVSQPMLAATIQVPQQYSSIQAAVNAAAPGDTILVAPGTYLENVTIQKSLQLRSRAGAIVTTIDGGGRGSPVALWGAGAEKITVQGFTLTGGAWNFESGLGYPNERGAGVYIDSVAEATIRNNIVIENHGCVGAGIASFFSNLFLYDNVIRENGPTESACPASEGIRADGDDNLSPVLVAERNYVIENGGIGVRVRGFKSITVRYNTITDNGEKPENLPVGGGLVAEMTRGVIANNFIARNVAYDSPALVLRNYSDPAMQFSVTGNSLIDNRSDGPTTSATLAAYRPSTIVFRDNILVGRSERDMFQCEGDGVVASRNFVTNFGSGGHASTCGY